MNRFSSMDIASLIECYDLWNTMQHKTGVCHDGLLRKVIDEYDQDELDARIPVKAASEDLLEEIARRWIHDNRQEQEDHTKLRAGCPIWYVDFEAGAIEAGKISSVQFKEEGVDSFSVDFENGDFDEFLGKAFGKCFFLYKNNAESALIGGKQ